MIVCKCHIHHWTDFHLLHTKSNERNKRMVHTLPLITTGRSNIPCMPRMADCGGLIIGVPNSEPNTPPLLIVNVPPSISSMDSEPCFALRTKEEFFTCFQMTGSQIYLLAKFSNSTFDIYEIHLFHITKHGHDQTLKRTISLFIQHFSLFNG